MAVILVSRHSGALTWLQRQLGVTDFQQVAHLHDLPMGPGDRVYGILPIAWAARICRAGAEAHILTLDVPPQLRGQELTATQMDDLGARLVRYDVRVIEGPVSGPANSAPPQAGNWEHKSGMPRRALFSQRD